MKNAHGLIRMQVLSRGWTSADTYWMGIAPQQVTTRGRKGIWREARRITLLGWAMVAAPIAVPAVMFALVVSRHLPVLAHCSFSEVLPSAG